MNNSRRGFLASFVTWLTALPFVKAITGKPKSFDFHVRVEEIGEERYRSTINCGSKQAIIESPTFDQGHPVELWAHCARMGMLFEVQRAMKLLAFPQDKEIWNNPVSHWFIEPERDELIINHMKFRLSNWEGREWQMETYEDFIERVNKTYPAIQTLQPDGKLNITPDLS